MWLGNLAVIIIVVQEAYDRGFELSELIATFRIVVV
jgi:hypothetical protein